MYKSIEKKVALITGASRGFGRAIALRLADEGASVIVNYRRSKTEADEVVQTIKARGGHAVAVRADVGKEEKIQQLFAFIQEQFGQLDIVVANASFGIPGKIIEARSKHWDVTLDSTAKSLLLLAQQAVPLMKPGGRIVSVTSYGGQKVLPDYGVVGPAKGAVESLTRSLSVELVSKGILVNGVMPGLSDTKSLRAIPGSDEALRRVEKQTPAGRLVSAEEVANVVAFLCSDQAAMIVGQFIIIDGGGFIAG